MSPAKALLRNKSPNASFEQLRTNIMTNVGNVIKINSRAAGTPRYKFSTTMKMIYNAAS
jgi:hypothetical protein